MSKSLVLPEKFDFSFHKTFTESIAAMLKDKSNRIIQLDFSRVQYLDSSALGMLVVANKKAKENGSAVEIINASGTAMEVLTIANFHKLITIK